MPRIIATTREPVYNAQGQLQGHLVHTDSVEDTATSPRRLHIQSAQACAHCHQAQTACRCLTPQAHTQAQEAQEDWLPLSILRLHESARPIEPEQDWLPLSILRLHESARPIEPEQDYLPLSILRRREP